MTTNDQLRAIIKERGYSNKDIANLLGLRVDPKRHQSSTVMHWTMGTRNMPAPMLELLKLKLPDKR